MSQLPDPRRDWSALLLVGVLCLVLGYYGAGFKDWPLCSAKQVKMWRGR